MVTHPTPYAVDADFRGGNILVESRDGERVFLRQDLRDTVGDWFYWAFRVRGAAGYRLSFHFAGSDVVGVRGAAISLGGGQSWRWLGTECVSHHNHQDADESTRWLVAFSYEFPPEANEVLFALCPRYTQAELDSLLAGKAHDSRLKREVLCHSRSGREVELLRLGDEAARFRLLLTCRHHACETLASFCLEGILEALLADDEAGRWLFENIQVAVVPFVDKDGVEAGDQGKNRAPYDHNRDYGGEISDSIYPEVKAVRQWAGQWLSEGQSSIVLDLHCPWIRGNHNEKVYFVGGPNTAVWERVGKFSQFLEAERNGGLPLHEGNNLPFGQAWNVLSSHEIGQCSCSTWANGLSNVLFATSMEIPYANAEEVEVTPENCRALGHDLAFALFSYLSPIP